MKVGPEDAALDRTAAVAQPQQLRPRDHPVLARRELRNRPVQPHRTRWTKFAPCEGVKFVHPGHGGTVARPGSRSVRTSWRDRAGFVAENPAKRRFEERSTSLG